MSPSRRLLFVCHAATAATRAVAFPDDEPLEERERNLASALRPHLPSRATVLSSPARSARQTAGAVKSQVRIQPELADCDYGRWRGRALAEVLAAEPMQARSWLRDPAYAPPDGESMVEVIRRVGRWMDALDPGEAIVAVTHSAVIRAAIVHALMAPAESVRHIDVMPLSIITLSWASGRWIWRPQEIVSGF